MTDFANILDAPFLREWEERQASPVEAVPTPLAAWNKFCGDDGGRVGLARGWFVTIGANPGFGKSVLALNLAYSALAARESVGFISLEMSPEQLAARSYAIATGTNIRELERGEGFSRERFGTVCEKLQRIQLDAGLADFFVNRDPLHKVGDVLAHMDALRTSATVRWFVVDYLQLVGTGDDESIYQQVTEVATSLRLFANEHQVTVVGLSQFNRRTSADYTQSPRAQALHGGMSLEANSDQVILLDHSRYEQDPLRSHIARTWMVLDKNRHGPRGSFPVEWDYRTLSIREAQPDEESEWPQHPGGRR